MRKYDSKLRSNQAELTKAEISKAVDKLVHNKDIKSISVKEICTLARVSVGTFYLYFENKEQALLYNYRASDKVFDSMEFTQGDCPVDNLKQVLYRYIDMVEFEKIINIRQVYIAHLMYFDEYFFSDQRGLIKKILCIVEECQSQGKFTEKYTCKEVTIKLLRFVRGILYDLCIRTKLIDTDTWKEQSHKEIDEYISLFCVQNS